MAINIACKATGPTGTFGLHHPKEYHCYRGKINILSSFTHVVSSRYGFISYVEHRRYFESFKFLSNESLKQMGIRPRAAHLIVF